MMAALADLITISRAVGERIDLVQGGGGNTSVKAAGNMYIKASGTPLKKMSEERGWATVVTATGEVSDPERQQRPSMEMPMHLLLPPVVIHTHAVYVNVFGCMVGGRTQLAELLASWRPIFIPYTTPGHELAAVIQGQLANVERSDAPSLYILENHGMIACAANATDALALTLQVSDHLRQVLIKRLADFVSFTVDQVKPAPARLPSLFPDAAVFAETQQLTPGVAEILSVNAYLHHTITALGGVAQPLPAAEGAKLRSLESEQYRVQQSAAAI